jgi:4-amino-4-deoxy-L-arabinose transferase-like glycosyltransferase
MAGRIVTTARRDCALLILVCAVTMFVGLGNTALWEPDEPRFAEATRQMFTRGDFLTPWFNNSPRFEKPILMYWMQVPFVATLGATETAFRLPSAIAGLCTVLLIYSLGAHLVSPRTGLIAGLSLATTMRFVVYARQGLTDIPATAFVTLTIYGFVRALDEPVQSRRYALLAWIGVAGAALTKGPVAVLGLLVVLLFALIYVRTPVWRRLHVVPGLLLAAAMVLPWFVFMITKHGRAFVDVAIGHEVVARYLSSDFPGRDRGPLFFWTVWPGDGAPWSLLCTSAFVWMAWRWRVLEAPVRRGAALAALWFLTVLVVFSFSQYKLPHYIIPAYPAMALLVGIFADAYLARRAVPSPLWTVPMYIIGLALIGLAFLLSLLLQRAFDLPLNDAAFVLPVALVLGGIAILVAQFMQRELRALGALVAIIVFAYGYIGLVIAPQELRKFQPVPSLAHVVRHVSAPNQPVAVLGTYAMPGLVFYAGRPVVALREREEVIDFLSSPGPHICVLARSDYDAIRGSMPPAHVIAGEGDVFSVRMSRLLESEPERKTNTLLVVTTP